MKVFRSIPGDSTSLVDNIIYCIFQASDSMIWIGTGNGLSIYNPFTRSLKNFPFDREKPGGFPVQRINSFCELKKGSVWIGTPDGIVNAVANGSRFTRLRMTNCVKPEDMEYYYNNVASILPDPRKPKLLLVATARGLVQYDTARQMILNKYLGPPKVDLITKELHPDSNGVIWVCGWGVGVGHFDLKTEQWKIYSPVKWGISTMTILPKSADEFWVASDDRGLGVFNKKTGNFLFYKHDPSDPRSLSSNTILGLSYFNNHQDFWVWGDGINVENRDFCSFRQVKVPYKFWWICDFFKDAGSGKLLIGAYRCNGMPVFDTKRNSWSLVPAEKPFPQRGISITGFYKDSRKRLWVATRNNLCYYDPEANRLRTFLTREGKPLQLVDSVVYGMNEDHQGNLWVGTRFDGVIRIDPSRKKADYFRNNPGDPNSLLGGTHYTSIQTDRFNRVWLGCRYGVSIYDPVTNRFDNTLMDTLMKYGIKKRWVNGMEKDTLGRIWLSIAGSGLVRIEIRSDSSYGIRLFHSGNGLNDQETAWITKDSQSNFWVTNSGLLRVDPYRERFLIIDDQNGLHETSGSSQKIFVDQTGNIYVGDSVGFETRNIRDIRLPEKTSFNVVFESLEINGKEIHDRISGHRSLSLNLQADQNNLVFHYTAVCFHSMGMIRYRYRLEGYDQGWISAEFSREARYTNLPPGKYVFTAEASDGGNWHACKAPVHIVIHPFFWQTWWFILLCVISLSAMVVFIYRYRVNQLLKMERMRSRIATDLHDDVSSTLSSISILSEILATQTNDTRSNGMIGEIGNNSREMLERIDDIIWSVNPKNDKFQDLGLRIREYAIPLFESKNLTFEVDIPVQMAGISLPMEVRRNIYLIAKEAVNNLVKYSGCQHASIRFHMEHSILSMTITDDGAGFDPGMATSRNGIRNMKARAGTIGGKLNICSSPGKGTSIHLVAGC